MRIVFFGTGEIGLPSFDALRRSSDHSVAAVFTQPDRPAGRKRELKPSPIKVAAEAAGIPVHQPERVRDPESMAALKALEPELIIVAAYGQILRAELLGLPQHGCLNIHASLLPRHRGASPINAAILNGDEESGITVMQMDAGLDTGDILLARAIPLGPAETAGELHDRLAELAPGVLMETLARLKAGTLQAIPQEESRATHAPKLSRADGRVDWSRSAIEIDRQIRGLNPWPGAFTSWPGDESKTLKIHSAALVEHHGGAGERPGTVLECGAEILIAAGTGAISLQILQLPGGRALSAGELWRGNVLQVGDRMGAGDEGGAGK